MPTSRRMIGQAKSSSAERAGVDGSARRTASAVAGAFMHGAYTGDLRPRPRRRVPPLERRCARKTPRRNGTRRAMRRGSAVVDVADVPVAVAPTVVAAAVTVVTMTVPMAVVTIVVAIDRVRADDRCVVVRLIVRRVRRDVDRRGTPGVVVAVAGVADVERIPRPTERHVESDTIRGGGRGIGHSACQRDRADGGSNASAKVHSVLLMGAGAVGFRPLRRPAWLQ